MEVIYTPGAGVLVGAGRRWLLLGHDPGSATTQLLWDQLTGPRVDPEEVLAGLPGDASLVLVDLTTGAETSLTRGVGRHTTRDGVHTLTLAPAAGGPDPGAGRRLVGGVVDAESVVLRPESPARPIPATPVVSLAGGPPPLAPTPAPTAGVIDGIPPEILAPRAPGRTTRRAPGPDDPDHDGQTTRRPEPPVAPEPPEPPSQPGTHLSPTPTETVLAVHCPAGHVTAAYSPRCRVCDDPVPEQEPHQMPRPRLGVLHLPDGERVPLDRGVVFGRQPDAVPGGAPWPHLVRLPPDATYVSRSHLAVELDGWLVLATDLGSRGGTTLRVPGRTPQRIRGHETYVWEPGQVLDLADSYEIVYEVAT